MPLAELNASMPDGILFRAVPTRTPFYRPNDELQNQEPFLKVGRNEAWPFKGFAGDTPIWDYQNPAWFEDDVVVKAA